LKRAPAPKGALPRASMPRCAPMRHQRLSPPFPASQPRARCRHHHHALAARASLGTRSSMRPRTYLSWLDPLTAIAAGDTCAGLPRLPFPLICPLASRRSSTPPYVLTRLFKRLPFSPRVLKPPPSAIAAAVLSTHLCPLPPPAKLHSTSTRPHSSFHNRWLLRIAPVLIVSEVRRPHHRGLAAAPLRSRLRLSRRHQSNPGEPNRTSLPFFILVRPWTSPASCPPLEGHSCKSQGHRCEPMDLVVRI
jgi:hypothetical protein